MTTAVLDIGKTNVKLTVVRADGTAAWTRRQPNRWLPGPPYPHADTEAIWAFATAGLRAAARDHRIDAIVTTTHGATAAIVDDGGLALPVLDYEHPAPAAEEHGYAAVRPAFEETLSPNLPAGLNLGRQLHWQQQRFPDAFARASHILAYPQYWSWRLSGVAASEVTSFGTHTDLWRPREGRPSMLVERCGWGRLLPAFREAHAVLGPIAENVARATGLDPACRVVCGIHDSNASLAPHLLAREAPFTVVSTGTWVVLMAVGACGTLDERRDMLANVNLRGEPVSTARFMGGREFEALVPAGAAPATAEDVAAVLAAGAMVLPGFAPGSGPFPSGTGRIEGTVPDGAGSRAALASLYLALMTDVCLDLLGAAGDVVIEGALAANAAYLQSLAALRPGCAVMASADAAGTTQGAALLATWPRRPPLPPLGRVTAGPWPQLASYRATWRRLAEGGPTS